MWWLQIHPHQLPPFAELPPESLAFQPLNPDLALASPCMETQGIIQLTQHWQCRSICVPFKTPNVLSVCLYAARLMQPDRETGIEKLQRQLSCCIAFPSSSRAAISGALVCHAGNAKAGCIFAVLASASCRIWQALAMLHKVLPAQWHLQCCSSKDFLPDRKFRSLLQAQRSSRFVCKAKACHSLISLLTWLEVKPGISQKVGLASRIGRHTFLQAPPQS